MSLAGPARLVASLPAVLGRQPEEEVLLVGTTPELSASAAALVSIPLDGATDPRLRVACVTAVEYLKRSGASHVVAVAWAREAADWHSAAARTAGTLTLLAEDAGLAVLDALWVTPDRWRSYRCVNPSCCPPEGNPLPTPEEIT